MLNIVVALACEAKPIRRFFSLQRSATGQSFPVYQNDEMRLIISGVGKVNAAAAVAYLQALGNESSGKWLNIGVAGYADLDVGELILINRITDKTTGENWYPPIVYKHTCRTGALITVDAPQTDYQGETAFDMEASGYYPTATRFASGELVQCIKVISDNRQQTIESINASRIERLIADNMDNIDKLASALNGLHNSLPDVENDTFAALIGAWHFTATQRHQLNDLLKACHARGVDVSMETVKDFNRASVSASDVLTCISRKLEVTPIAFTR